MNAAELREALDWLNNYGWHGGPSKHYEERLKRHEIAEHALRTIALPILEADPELVERIAGTIWKHDPQRLTGFAPDYLAIARTVLAAISTPTPVEES